MSAPSSPNSYRRMRLIGLIVLLCAVFAVAWGIFSRRAAHADLVSDAEQAAIPHVGVMHPLSDESGGELVLPGTLQAWVETPIYAHTSGYLKSWKVDIGQAVTAGQLIAEIETPEIVQQA
ncbi:MAG: efflux RND transporter periplasmic adaptor subunit, partial [Gallionella sp.]